MLVSTLRQVCKNVADGVRAEPPPLPSPPRYSREGPEPVEPIEPRWSWDAAGTFSALARRDAWLAPPPAGGAWREPTLPGRAQGERP